MMKYIVEKQNYFLEFHWDSYTRYAGTNLLDLTFSQNKGKEKTAHKECFFF